MYPTFALIIPTLNAEHDLPELFDGILSQSLQPNKILVIDSHSTDNTLALLDKLPVIIHSINRSDFDHGGTRQLGTMLVNTDLYVFMTQDAIPAHPDTFKNLIHALLANEKMGCVYGRQLPKKNADPISIHGRLFNYPETSYIRSYEDRKKYGIKTCFNSDNLAAYRKSALNEIGGFPHPMITGEDAFVAATLLKHGYLIGYVSTALIYHSHNLTLRQEFHRYFSVGVFHRRAHWILKEFSTADSEGFRFVTSELVFLLKQKKILWIMKAFFSTVIKYLAYKIGLHEQYIPFRIKKKWGVSKNFWIMEQSKAFSL